MNVQRHTSLLDRGSSFGFHKKPGAIVAPRKVEVPSVTSNSPRRAMSPPPGYQSPTPGSQPKSPDSSDGPGQRQFFQRSSLRSSGSSVHSEGPVLRKAVSFGQTMRYEFPTSASKIPAPSGPTTNGLPTRPANGAPNFLTSTPNYRSLPVPKNYHTAMAQKVPLQQNAVPAQEGSSDSRVILRNRFGSLQLRSPPATNVQASGGTRIPYANGHLRNSIGLPLPVPDTNMQQTTLPLAANGHATLGFGQRSSGSVTSPEDAVFLKAPPGGLRPTDWSDTDGGAPNRRNRPMKREERRHTVAGENVVTLPPVHSRSMDPIRVEGPSHLYTTQRSHSMYQPPSSIYDDDPGIMSEAETSATGFRRGGKQRSSLPVVRTPNKSLERPLGLVFLQYRNETKRALLPNEITSLDTVKALFVRSFPMQLSMEYLESPHLRIYIHDPSKDMFYELEDLRDIRDRSVLRIYEQDVNGGAPRSTWDQDTSYFSEPEFDSEYQHQHIHRAKASSKSLVPVAAPAPSPVPPQTSNYYGIAHASYVGTGRTATLPHPGSHRSYSPATLSERAKTQTLPHPGTDIGSRTLPLPDRRIEHHRSYPMYLTPTQSYEEPYYSTYGSRSGSVTPVIDEEARRDGYILPAHGVQTLDQIRYRARVEYMERQLASLTGLVHKALTTSRPPPIQRDIEINLSRELLQVPTGRDAVAVYKGEVCEVKPSVSSSSSPSLSDECKPESKTIPRPLSKEEKSVSFSDDPPTMSSPTHTKQHSPQHTDREGRQSNKPTPPPKPSSLVGSLHDCKMMPSGRDLQITPEMYNQLRLLKKRTKDLRVEVRNLRRITQAQALNIKETIRETFVKIKAMLAAVEADNDVVRAERNRVSREEEMYRHDISQLESNLSELEIEVEDLRSNVINRRCRVNMSEVESMALILSKASKTVADLKGRYPYLQENLKSVMAAEMEVIVKEEKFLKEEPDRLENALRRCKKLTGTLVTLKRLASVQEQRLPPTSPGLEQRAASLPSSDSIGEQHFDGMSIGPDGQFSKAASFSGEMSRQSSVSGDSARGSSKGENALDALLDELQIAAKPPDAKSDIYANTRAFKRLPSYPSSDSPLKGQVVSQGPAGPVSLTVTTAPISKLQVSDSGSRQSVSLSPAPSPVPPADGKLSPQPPELFARGLRQTVIEGPNGTGPDKASSLSPAMGSQAKKVPPPPPPRTSSKSPLVSPTSPMSPSGRMAAHMPRTGSLQVAGYNIPPVEVPPRPTTNGAANGPRSRKSSLEASGGRQAPLNNGEAKEGPGVLRTVAISDENLRRDQLSSNSSSSESVNSQEGVQTKKAEGGASDAENKKTPPTPPTRNRQEILEQRHQELLRRQRQLQEQYARLQQMQRGQTLQRFSPPRSPADLKKTGSESNILSKAGLAMSTTSGSLTHLAAGPFGHNSLMTSSAPSSTATTTAAGPTTKIYETDIL